MRTERLTGLHPVREALRARRRSLVRLQLGADVRRPAHDEIAALAREAGVRVERAPRGAQSDALGLEAGPLPELSLEELLAAEPVCLVLLDGVEDPQNLGAICRVAETAGTNGLILSRRRAPPLTPAVSRASAGAVEHLPVARVPNLSRALELLKSEGFWMLGADPTSDLGLFQAPDAVFSGRLVIVLGAEGRGLRPGVLRRIDHRVRIPMRGRIGSLNVSAAAAVVLFERVRRGAAAD